MRAPREQQRQLEKYGVGIVEFHKHWGEHAHDEYAQRGQQDDEVDVPAKRVGMAGACSQPECSDWIIPFSFEVCQFYGIYDTLQRIV